MAWAPTFASATEPHVRTPTGSSASLAATGHARPKRVVAGPGIVSLADGRYLVPQALNDTSSWAAQLSISPDGRFAATVLANQLALYDLRAGVSLGHRILRDASGGARFLGRADFIDGGRLLLVRWNQGAWIYDPERDEIVAELDAAVGSGLGLPAAFARHAGVGIAIRSVGLVRQIAAVSVDVSGPHARITTSHVWPIGRACLGRPILAAAISGNGRTAVLRCGHTLEVLRLPSGSASTVPLPAKIDRPIGTGPSVYVGDGGRWALVVDRYGPGPSGTWVDLEDGSSRPLSAKRVQSVVGVFGHKAPMAVVTDDGGGSQTLVHALRPDGSEQWRLEIPLTTRVAYAEAADAFLFVSIANGSGRRGAILVDHTGRIVGAIRSNVQHMGTPRPDDDAGRIYFGCGSGLSPYLDLRDGRVHRPVPGASHSRAPPSVLRVDLLGRVMDCRSSTGVPIAPSAPGSGASPPARVGRFRRTSDRWLLLRSTDRIGVVDLAKRRVLRWIPVPHADRLKFGYVGRDGSDVLLLDGDGALTVRGPTGRLLASRHTPWKASKYGDSPVHDMVELPGGAMLAGGSFGLALAPSMRRPDFTRLTESIDVRELDLAPGGSNVLVDTNASGLFLCPVRPNRLRPGDCAVLRARSILHAASAGRRAAFFDRGKRVAVSNDTGAIDIWDTGSRTLVATAYVKHPSTGLQVVASTRPTLTLTPDGYFAGDDLATGLGVETRGTSLAPLGVGAPDRDRPDIVLGRIRPGSPSRPGAGRGHAPDEAGAASTLLAGRMTRLRLGSPLPWIAKGQSLRLSLIIDGPVGAGAVLEARDDGRRVAVPSNAVRPGEGRPIRRTLVVPLTPGSNTISVRLVDADHRIIATRRFVVAAEPKRFPMPHVYYLGLHLVGPAGSAADLTQGATDVSNVAAALHGLMGGAAHTKVLTRFASTSQELDAAHAFLEQAHRGDVVIVFLSGRGLVAPDGTLELAPRGPYGPMPTSDALSFAAMRKLTSGLRTTRTAVLVDSCCSAGTFPSGQSAPTHGYMWGTIVVRSAHPTAIAGGDDDFAFDRAVAHLKVWPGTALIVSAARYELDYRAHMGDRIGGLLAHAFIGTLLGQRSRVRGALYANAVLAETWLLEKTLSQGKLEPVVRNRAFAIGTPLVNATPSRLVQARRRDIYVQGAVVDPDGRHLVIVARRRLKILPLAGDDLGKTTKLPFDPKSSGCFPFQAGTWAVQVGAGAAWVEIASCRGVFRYDLGSGKWQRIAPAAPASDSVLATAISPDGRFVADCTGEHVRAVDTRARSARWVSAALPCRQVAYSSTVGAFVATAESPLAYSLRIGNGGLKTVATNTGTAMRRFINELGKNAGTTNDVADLSPDGRYLLAAHLPRSALLPIRSYLMTVDLATGRFSEIATRRHGTFEVITRSGIVTLGARPGRSSARIGSSIVHVPGGLVTRDARSTVWLHSVIVADDRGPKLSVWQSRHDDALRLSVVLGDRVVGSTDWSKWEAEASNRFEGPVVREVFHAADGEPLGSLSVAGSLLAGGGTNLYAVTPRARSVGLTLRGKARRPGAKP